MRAEFVHIHYNCVRIKCLTSDLIFYSPSLLVRVQLTMIAHLVPSTWSYFERNIFSTHTDAIRTMTLVYFLFHRGNFFRELMRNPEIEARVDDLVVKFIKRAIYPKGA